MSNIKFENCEIHDGVLNGSHIGDNNDSGIFNFNEMKKCFDNIVDCSDDVNERQLASEARKLCSVSKKTELRNLFIQNISAFSSGTFATVAGGLLLEMIKSFLK